jgi:hypothetical protein
VSVDVKEPGALGSRHERRLAADRAKGPRRTVDSTGDHSARSSELFVAATELKVRAGCGWRKHGAGFTGVAKQTSYPNDLEHFRSSAMCDQSEDIRQPDQASSQTNLSSGFQSFRMRQSFFTRCSRPEEILGSPPISRGGTDE